MKASGCILSFFFVFSSISSLSVALTDAEASFLARRQLLTLPEGGDLPENYENGVEPNLKFPNPRLRRAYIALQAWKKSMYSDPLKTTANWVGPDVCKYTGVFCEKALDDPNIDVVASIDLNGADIAGFLPAELGLLHEVAVFHINSNRFCGIVPQSFCQLSLLHEFDISNNRFVGEFPKVVHCLPALRYLDIRYNDFEGCLPPELFNKDLDALFLNNNRFRCNIPETIGNSNVSVLVIANNNFEGCIPSSIGKMRNLNELIFSNNKLGGCVPPELFQISNVTVLDISSNTFSGILSKSFKIENVEEFSLANNNLTGTSHSPTTSSTALPKNACQPRGRTW
ncbi:putative leucine-rich repeat-containing, plant-type, leucine-rich repeat domain, L [Rosa chinensis]|uniref:Cell wall hydroxyproline-rich glycoprotein n=1 Tax=Rosa chinensis TaxID=74649 RepID=A0A2P6Q534_ROSCH|nr:putative leucine-rich repeat-containing, plant-type, leucine-rich repeat domain, L [Rosa chinensis]